MQRMNTDEHRIKPCPSVSLRCQDLHRKNTDEHRIKTVSVRCQDLHQKNTVLVSPITYADSLQCLVIRALQSALQRSQMTLAAQIVIASCLIVLLSFFYVSVCHGVSELCIYHTDAYGVVGVIGTTY